MSRIKGSIMLLLILGLYLQAAASHIWQASGLGSLTAYPGAVPPFTHAGYIGEVWDPLQRRFRALLVIDGRVVQTYQIVLPPTQPLTPNVVISWTQQLSPGIHTISFYAMVVPQRSDEDTNVVFSFELDNVVVP